MWNDKEIALSRRLHELGVRPEIRHGDFYMDVYGRPTLCVYASASPSHHPYPGEVDFLLWSWERCREWLKEKGFVNLAIDIEGNKTIVSVPIGAFKNNFDGHFEGQTDLEAILAVMVQMAEEGKSES